MSELTLQPTVDAGIRTNGQAPDRSRRIRLQKGLAGVLGLVLMGAVLAPIAQNWRETRKDNFPFSYYPMFSEKRGKAYSVNYIVGVDGQGNRQRIPHQLAGPGGLNQTRRQINRLEREGKAGELCQAIARRVGREAALPYSGIVTIQVVTGRFRFADYFAGNKTPLSEKVRASCQIVRGKEAEETTEDEP